MLRHLYPIHSVNKNRNRTDTRFHILKKRIFSVNFCFKHFRLDHFDSRHSRSYVCILVQSVATSTFQGLMSKVSIQPHFLHSETFAEYQQRVSLRPPPSSSQHFLILEGIAFNTVTIKSKLRLSSLGQKIGQGKFSLSICGGCGGRNKGVDRKKGEMGSGMDENLTKNVHR